MEYYEDKPWVAFVSFGLASAIGAQRVHDGQHWASEVFLGAAIGTAIGYLVYKNAEKRPDWIVLPQVSSDFYGLSVAHNFGDGGGYQPRYTE